MRRSPFQDAVVQIEQPESSQIPRVRIHLAAEDKIAEPIHARHGIAHPDFVKQGRSGKFQVGLIVPDGPFHGVDAKQGIVVFVIPAGPGPLG